MNTVRFIFFFALIMSSCIKRETTSIESLFEAKPRIIANYQKMDISETIFGNPIEMIVVDSILFIRDKFDGYNISILNLNNRKQIRRFVKIGNGPDEVHFLSNLEAMGSEEISFTAPNPTRLINYKIIDVIKKEEPKPFNVTEPVTNEQWLYDPIFFPAINKYISKGFFHEGKYAIIDKYGRIEKTIGQLPSRYIGEIEPHLLNSAYQGYIRRKPDGNKISHFSGTCDLIEIIDSSFNIKRFQTFDPEIKLMDGMVAHATSSPYGFTSLSVNNSYLYALYSGRCINNHGHDFRFGKAIYVFDWELNPVKSYTFDIDVICIAVCSNNKELYFLGLDSDEISLFHIGI